MRVILNLEGVMKEYNTEQKKILISFFQKNNQKAYTIEEIANELQLTYQKDAPGKSTVYRLIPHLVEEGLITRLPKAQGRGFIYQSLESEKCHGHLHMKCKRCGKLFHLDDELSEELLHKVRDLCGFSINERDSVLLGNCLGCR